VKRTPKGEPLTYEQETAIREATEADREATAEQTTEANPEATVEQTTEQATEATERRGGKRAGPWQPSDPLTALGCRALAAGIEDVLFDPTSEVEYLGTILLRSVEKDGTAVLIFAPTMMPRNTVLRAVRWAWTGEPDYTVAADGSACIRATYKASKPIVETV
jgi:hypothetical protein